MWGPQVRFCESWGGAIPPGYSTKIAVPTGLLRIGVYRNLEARIGVPPVALLWDDDGYAERDVGALELSAKLVYPAGAAAVGLLPMLFLPVEGDAYDDVGVGAGVKGLWAVELTPRVGLGGNIGAIASGLGASEADVRWEYLVSVAVGIGLTERLGSFVEVYGIVEDAGEAQAVLDTGLTFLIWDRLQLDMYIGLDVVQGAGLAGAGFSLLL